MSARFGSCQRTAAGYDLPCPLLGSLLTPNERIQIGCQLAHGNHPIRRLKLKHIGENQEFKVEKAANLALHLGHSHPVKAVQTGKLKFGRLLAVSPKCFREVWENGLLFPIDVLLGLGNHRPQLNSHRIGNQEEGVEGRLTLFILDPLDGLPRQTCHRRKATDLPSPKGDSWTVPASTVLHGGDRSTAQKSFRLSLPGSRAGVNLTFGRRRMLQLWTKMQHVGQHSPSQLHP